MKKLSTLAIAATLITAPTLALAKDGRHNKQDEYINYQGPVAITKVSQLLADQSMFTETQVVLEGQLVRQMSADTFIFSDGEAEIHVEIEDINFKQPLNHQTKLRIFGEYEGGSTPEVEVEHIQVINKV